MILVFGTICIDRVRQVPRLPGPGGYVEMLTDEDMLGGEAANTALALHEWGAQIILAGNSLGAGADGALLEQMLRRRTLPLEHLRRGAVEAPVCDVYVTPDADRTMFGKGFSRMKETVDPGSVPYMPGEWFTAEPNMGEAARETARLAAEKEMKVYLMDFIQENEPIQKGGYWQSSTDWAGFRGNMQKNVVWLRRWVEKHGCYGILSDGPNGFVAGSPDQPVRVYPPYPAPVIVDTTGAGDMFRAGMLYGLDKEWPTWKCLQFASAAGCLKCKGLGGTGYIPSVDEIEGHLAEHDEISRHYLPT